MIGDQDGVRYQEEDYAGLLRRLSLQVIDVVIVGLIVFAGVVIDEFRRDSDYSDGAYIFTYASGLLAYGYFIILKITPIGTLGQRLTNTEIRTIKGLRPGIFRMTYRMLFWILGPINVIADIGFVSLNREKRTLRDCVCNTVVVKRKSVPIQANAKTKMAHVFFFGFNILYETAYEN